MNVYIARSALTTLLLTLAQQREPGITGLWLDFSETTSANCNWSVAKIEHDPAIGEGSARAAVSEAVRDNATWTMVADGDPRDGEPAIGSDHRP